MSGLARVPLGAAAGVSAIIITLALALGAGSAVQDTSNLRSKAKIAAAAPTISQYEDDDDEVTVCINGFATHEVSADAAATLVASGVATYGPCGGFFSFRR